MNIKTYLQKYPILKDFVYAILISLFIIFIIISLIRFFTFHGEEYPVPNLIGYNANQLERYKDDSNNQDFDLIINDSVFLPDVKKGIVVTQDPKPNMKVKKGRNIYLTVSCLTLPEVEMPNLIDLSLRQAENMLISNNLKLAQVIYKPSKFPNAVLEQRYKGREINAGKMIPYESSITLVVGKEVDSEFDDGFESEIIE